MAIKIDPTRARQVEELERLASWMDDRFVIPGTGIRFGLDPVLGLIPGIGDTAASLISAYVIYRAFSLGVPRALLARMCGNVVLDWLVGLVPVVGDLFDFGFKANRRNARLLREHMVGLR
jgi:hypothetical protein